MPRDPYTALAVPATLSDAPRAIPGQLTLPLNLAGYREDWKLYALNQYRNAVQALYADQEPNS